MKYLILIFILQSTQVFSQCETRQYVSRADSLFNLQITKDNFRKGKVFLTLDTINMSDVFAPSTYLETTDPSLIVKNYTRFIKSIRLEGTYYNYYELINSPFYESPLIISYFINTKTSSYFIRIWTDPNDTSKIEGLTVGKYPQKVEKTPW